MASAHIIGPAILASKRIIDRKSLLFDAEFDLSDGDKLYAALRYYINDNRDFLDYTPYIVYAKVLKTPDAGVQITLQGGAKETLGSDSYDIVGDIDLLYRTTNSEVTKTPYLTVIGSARNIIKEDGTFDITPSQFTVLTRNISQPKLPVRATFDSPKYNREGSKKPIPTASSTIEAGGFLTRMLPNAKDVEKADMFVMSVEDLHFLNSLGESSGNSQTTPRSKIGQKSKRKSFADQLADEDDDIVAPAMKRIKVEPPSPTPSNKENVQLTQGEDKLDSGRAVRKVAAKGKNGKNAD